LKAILVAVNWQEQELFLKLFTRTRFCDYKYMYLAS